MDILFLLFDVNKQKNNNNNKQIFIFLLIIYLVCATTEEKLPYKSCGVINNLIDVI
jgi:hypothetical protein